MSDFHFFAGADIGSYDADTGSLSLHLYVQSHACADMGLKMYHYSCTTVVVRTTITPILVVVLCL